MPTVAYIDGHALGGGAELALACDLRVGGPGATFAFPETRLGIIPGCACVSRHACVCIVGCTSLAASECVRRALKRLCCRAGGTQRLPRVVGRPRAKELVFTGRRVGAQEALHLGMVCGARAASVLAQPQGCWITWRRETMGTTARSTWRRK